jgi:hypothetical protein
MFDYSAHKKNFETSRNHEILCWNLLAYDTNNQCILYKQRNFLKELISNCSDVCDKIRYESLKNAKVIEEKKNLRLMFF